MAPWKAGGGGKEMDRAHTVYLPLDYDVAAAPTRPLDFPHHLVI